MLPDPLENPVTFPVTREAVHVKAAPEVSAVSEILVVFPLQMLSYMGLFVTFGFGYKVITIALDVAGFPVRQVESAVSMQVMVSPSDGIQQYTGLFVPTICSFFLPLEGRNWTAIHRMGGKANRYTCTDGIGCGSGNGHTDRKKGMHSGNDCVGLGGVAGRAGRIGSKDACNGVTV